MFLFCNVINFLKLQFKYKYFLKLQYNNFCILQNSFCFAEYNYSTKQELFYKIQMQYLSFQKYFYLNCNFNKFITLQNKNIIF
jgi:hypothetical protein